MIPAVRSLHHRCRSLQSCRLYRRDCVGHLWEYQDHHSQQLRKELLKRRKRITGHSMAHLVESLGKCDDCMMNQRARYFASMYCNRAMQGTGICSCSNGSSLIITYMSDSTCPVYVHRDCMAVRIPTYIFVPHYHGNGQYQWGN